MKQTQLLLLFLVCLGCTTQSDVNTIIEIESPTNISAQQAEVIVRFDDRYPIELGYTDSLLYIQQRLVNYHYIVYDFRADKLIDSVVPIGSAPNNLLYPEFVSSVQSSEIVIFDSGVGEFFVPRFSNDGFCLKNLEGLPTDLTASSDLSVSAKFIAGRKMAIGEPSMFYIYNKEDSLLHNVSPSPKLLNEIADPNYTYAAVVGLNEEKNRVVGGMYFFDLIHLYDLGGNLIKSVHFSQNSIPSVNSETKSLDLSDGYSGIVRVFPTRDYCYLMRITEAPEHIQRSDKMILQLNWEGELIQAYAFEDNITGRFYVDETNKKLYAIRHRIESDDLELFEVVSYRL